MGNLSIVRLPKGSSATVIFLGSFDALAKVFAERKKIPQNPQWHPEVEETQPVFVRVMFSIADHHLDDVLGVWVSPDNKTWSCALNKERNQVGVVEGKEGRKLHYLSCAPACLRRAVEGALERAAMRDLARNPEIFPKTTRGEGQ